MSAGHYLAGVAEAETRKKCLPRWITADNTVRRLIRDDVESTARVCPKALTGESTGGLLSSENTKSRRPS
jgi:hypothetical protein